MGIANSPNKKKNDNKYRLPGRKNESRIPVLKKSLETKMHYQKAASSKMILADAEWKWGWDALILMVTVYYGLAVPRVWLLHWVDVFPTAMYLTIECVCTVLAGVDIYFNFWTAYVNKHSRLVEDSRQITLHYLSHWFVVDFLSTFPLDLILLAAGKTSAWRVAYQFRLLKLFKIPHLWGMTARGNISGTYVFFHYHLIPNIRLFTFGIIFVHFFTIIWLALQWAESPSQKKVTEFDQEYVTALYFIVYTIATVGFGDLDVAGTGQWLYCVFLFFVSITVNGYIVGSLASSAQRYDVKREMKDKMRETLSIVEHYDIPTDLQQEVLAFQLHLLTHKVAASYTEVIGTLPKPMKKRLGLYIRVKFVSDVYLFANVSAEALLALAQRLKTMVVEPEEYIIKAGEQGQEMFFLGHGFCDVISFEGNFLATIKKGTYFGEIALLLETNRTASIKALTYCDLFRLDKKDFLEIMDKFPDLRDEVDKEINRRKKEMEGKDQEQKRVGGSMQSSVVAQNSLHGSGSHRNSTSTTHSAIGPLATSRASSISSYVSTDDVVPLSLAGSLRDGNASTTSLLANSSRANLLPPNPPPPPPYKKTPSHTHIASSSSSSNSNPSSTNNNGNETKKKRAVTLSFVESFSFGDAAVEEGDSDEDEKTPAADLEEMESDMAIADKKKALLKRKKSMVVPLSFREDTMSEIGDEKNGSGIFTSDGDSMQPPPGQLTGKSSKNEILQVEDWDDRSTAMDSANEELQQLIGPGPAAQIVSESEYRLQKLESLVHDLSNLVVTIETNLVARLGEIDRNVAAAVDDDC